MMFALHCLFFCLQHAVALDLVPLDPLDVKSTNQKLRSASRTSATDWTVLQDETVPIHVDDGLTFSRDIQKLDASFELHLEQGYCRSHDKYGDNNCHYNWGGVILGNYTVVLPQLIDEGDTMMGDFRVRRDNVHEIYLISVFSYHSLLSVCFSRLMGSCHISSRAIFVGSLACSRFP